ncbi:carbonic anhydrase family protein [Ideonella sp. DXS29W]|uniref:carbonic anhydrase n=1 Tax=Ideonella lacteola TaxID=2984193 RepID=A0ABU9BJ87_9BURK
MPWNQPLSRFVRPVALTSLALACAMTTAWAGGGHDEEKAPAKPTGKEARPGKDAASADAMDTLRQRLAERLGAQKPPENGNPNVVRVDNRATAAPAAAAGAGGSVASSHAVASTAAKVNGRPPPPAPRRAERIEREPDPRLAAPAAHAAPHGDHWDYNGEVGPDAWGKLKPEFNKCSTGQRQSPIDIRGGIAVQLEPIQFDYRTTGFSVIDNGHTVQVNLPSGNSINVLGRRFDLLQFHFHRPSEERINGKQFDMVAHLVHKDAEGKLAVVAVLLDRGAAQPLIQAVWNALPLEKNELQAAPGTIDLNKLLPEDRRYYTYMGSLTTPPCSEGVLWMVMKTPVPVSPEQIEIFSRLYPMNARPVQPLAGRLIKESN